jgi:hypothetical protein
MAPEQNPIELLLKVHGGLAKLVAPATPETLRDTKPRQGQLLVGMPPVVKLTMCAALFCLLGFLLTVPRPKSDGNPSISSTPTPVPGLSPAQPTETGGKR